MLSLSNPQTSSPTGVSRPRHLQLSQQLLDLEARVEVNWVDGNGRSGGLARWAPGFEERMVDWRFGPSHKAYVHLAISGKPIASLEYSQGLETFAGLYTDSYPAHDARVSSSSKLSISNGKLVQLETDQVNSLEWN